MTPLNAAVDAANRLALSALIRRLNVRMIAVREAFRAERDRIDRELGSQLLSAADAWEETGCVQGSAEHVAYARAQSWYAWADTSRYEDFAMALYDIIGGEIYGPGWIANDEDEALLKEARR